MAERFTTVTTDSGLEEMLVVFLLYKATGTIITATCMYRKAVCLKG